MKQALLWQRNQIEAEWQGHTASLFDRNTACIENTTHLNMIGRAWQDFFGADGLLGLALRAVGPMSPALRAIAPLGVALRAVAPQSYAPRGACLEERRQAHARACAAPG